jgi:outer membrane protein assembly factor BamB
MLNRMLLLSPSASSSDYIGYLTLSGRQGFGYGAVVDTAGSLYIAGQDYASDYSSARGYLSKIDSSGGVVWQKFLSGATFTEGRVVALDASENPHFAGSVEISGKNFGFVAKYNSSGTLQWQRTIGSTSNNGTYIRGIAIDSSGNIYVAGLFYDAVYASTLILAKLDASGALLWQRQLTTSGYSTDASHLAIDSSANIYVCGTSYNGSISSMLVAKYNTSGTLLWQRTTGTYGTYGRAVGVDSSGNVYAMGLTDTGFAQYSWQFFLIKFDTSGTNQWQRTLDSAASDYGQAVAVDNSANVYVSGFISSSNPNLAPLVKYNSSGALQWQREFASTIGVGVEALALDATGTPHLVAQFGTPGGTSFFVAKVPSAGTKTGTYSVGSYSVNYRTTSRTSTAASFAVSTSSLSSTTSSLTAATSTLTQSSASYTASVTTI